jgi:hypothetical protein
MLLVMLGSWRNRQCDENCPTTLIFKFVKSLSHDLKSGSMEAEGRMARIPDDLIAFLIGEIASSGQQGESFPSSSGMRQICPIVLVGKAASLPSSINTGLYHNSPLSLSNHYLMPIPCSPDFNNK